VIPQLILRFAADWAIRITLIAAITGAVLTALRIRHPRARHVAWLAVVAASLLLPLCRQLLPSISIPVLPAQTSGASLPLIASPIAGQPAPAVTHPRTQLPQLTAAPAPRTTRAWFAILAGVYLTMAGFLLARLALGTILARRLLRDSTIVDGRVVNVRCASPITVGWFRPVVLLPRNWRDWSTGQLTAVLSHENEHARWHDPLTQWLAALNTAIFWFHPLSWWLERRLNALAEESCDQAVLAGGTDPFDYAKWLLGFAHSVRQSGGLTRLAGMPMACALLSRLNRLTSGVRFIPAAPFRTVVAVLLCAVVSLGVSMGAIERVATLSITPVVAAIAPPPLPPQPAPVQRTRIARLNRKAPNPLPAVAAPPPAPVAPQPPGPQIVVYIDLDSLGAQARESAIADAKRNLASVRTPEAQATLVVHRAGSFETTRGLPAGSNEIVDAIDQLAAAPELPPGSAEPAGSGAVFRNLKSVAADLSPSAGPTRLLWVVGTAAIAPPPVHEQVRESEEALRSMGVQLRILPVSDTPVGHGF
jgi:beta-lactamase regulating signal transducer with metallopeptidase domain